MSLVFVGLVQLVLGQDDDLAVRPHVVARSESSVGGGGNSRGSGGRSGVSHHHMLGGPCRVTCGEREGGIESLVKMK